MKQSQTLIPTLKETPADADVKSHQLLLRAGYIRQNFSGVYTFLPLGKKVLKLIEDVIREEMDAIGGNEVLMPALQSAELWQESGRWDKMGDELMRLKDRHDRDFILGPTHEEVATSIVRDEIRSYKQLPLTLYQIQTKFRDERRPRFGLLRGREFIMKDAYSFHLTDESLDDSYQAMHQAYTKIFTRLGLNFRSVIADSGAMGGKDTQEFMALSEVGEDTIAYSTESDYAANIEMAEVYDDYKPSSETPLALEKVATPNQKTMQEVAEYFNKDVSQGLKSLLYKADDAFVLIITRGDHEVNDIKLKHVLKAETVEMATEMDAKEKLGADFGSLGAIKVDEDIQVICDLAVKSVANAFCGANEDGYHYINVNPSRDFGTFTYEDVRFIQVGDKSPDGQGTIEFAEGIEIGQVFKLGRFYADQLGAEVLNDQGRSESLTMGCYGIGVSRTLAAIVEQHHDESGIVWPKQVAPFDVHLVVVNSKNDEQRQMGDRLYQELLDQGIRVLYDDRKERAGVKFAESDLIGLPVRITVGKNSSEGIVEVKERIKADKVEMTLEQLQDYLKTI